MPDRNLFMMLISICSYLLVNKSLKPFELMGKTFLLFIASFLSILAHSQPLQVFPVELSLLNLSGDLSDNLLSSRSIVLVDVPNGQSGKSRGDWKGFAADAHGQLKQIGVDAVAYYNINDFYAGADATKNYLSSINPRGIKNILILRKKREILGEEVELVIIEKKSEDGLFIPNQNAYRIQRNALGEIMLQLGRDIYQKNLTNENFMILDQPEFFDDTDVVKGRRYETFNRDLKIGKLAVPAFEHFRFPKGFDSTQLSQDKLKLIQQYNQQIDQRNSVLEGIMEAYPYKYEIVDYSQGEEHLYRREFSYVLMFLNSTGRNIRELLNYEIDLTETDYITLKTIIDDVTTLEQIPVSTPVYKYYMKQLVNKEIYLGNQWDADLTWNEALINHINNFKDTVEKKK